MNTRPHFDEFGCVVDGSGESLLSLVAADVHAAMATYGVVLLRGFKVDSETFEAFTHTLCDVFNFHPHPKRAPVGHDGFSDLAPPGLHAIKLHTERAYEPAFARPQLLWFYCVRPASAAGETLLCDGAQLWSRFPAHIKELFTRNRLLYVLPYPSRLLQGDWTRHFITSTHPEVTREYAEEVLRSDPNIEYALLDQGRILVIKHVVPAIMASRFDGRIAFANNLLNRRFAAFVQFEDRTIVSEETLCEIDELAAPITFSVSWQAGDVLLVDNERILHGRHAHQDSTREVHVRFGRDRFAPPAQPAQ